MAYNLTHIHGIGPVHQTALSRHNVRNTDHLLHITSEPGPRRKLARNTGIPEAELRKWNDFVRLLRLPGIGPTYARMLEESGAGSVTELARQTVHVLAPKVAEACRAEGVRAPSKETVERWIGDAKTLYDHTAPW